MSITGVVVANDPSRRVAADLDNVVHALSPFRLLTVLGIPRPPADSVLFYAVLAAVGVAEIIEWPAVLVAAGAQLLVDRRLDEMARAEHLRAAR